MHDVVVDVVHPGNGRDRRAGLFTGFDNLGFKLPAIAAPPCAGRIKIDRVHVSTYFYVDTIFLPGLLAINVYGPDAYGGRPFHGLRSFLQAPGLGVLLCL